MSPSRSSVVLVVNCVSGTIWKIPIDLIATEPLVDNVLVIESAEVGKTSAVGFRLTSTTRCVCAIIIFFKLFPLDMKKAEYSWNVGCGVLRAGGRCSSQQRCFQAAAGTLRWLLPRGFYPLLAPQANSSLCPSHQPQHSASTEPDSPSRYWQHLFFGLLAIALMHLSSHIL